MIVSENGKYLNGSINDNVPKRAQGLSMAPMVTKVNTGRALSYAPNPRIGLDEQMKDQGILMKP